MKGCVQKEHKTEQDNSIVVAWNTIEAITFATGKYNKDAICLVSEYMHSEYSERDTPALT